MAQPFQSEEQYPLNAVGQKGQHAFVGVEKVFFRGTTGLVGTAYGIPGVTVSRTATGSYTVNYDPVHEIDIIPNLIVPTGQDAQLKFVEVNPTSGTAKFQITRPSPTGISGAPLLYNPPSGTIASLLIFGAPIIKF